MQNAARRVLNQIILETLNHRGTQMGHLIVTYGSFQRFGARRQSVKAATESLVAEGFIGFAQGKFTAPDRRQPNTFTLTWLSEDGYATTNDWRRVEPQHLCTNLKLIREKPPCRRAVAAFAHPIRCRFRTARVGLCQNHRFTSTISIQKISSPKSKIYAGSSQILEMREYCP